SRPPLAGGGPVASGAQRRSRDVCGRDAHLPRVRRRGRATARPGAVTAEPRAPTAQRTVDVALEARVRRWTIAELDGHLSFDDRPADHATGDLTRVAYGRSARIAVFAGPAPELERALRRAVLASGAELVPYLRTTDE